jgi:hypothetical protein
MLLGIARLLFFYSVFEIYHQVVGVADDDHVTPSHFLAPSFDPQVENVMQVYVSEQK